MYSKMKFLTDWKNGRKDEMAKMTDKIKRQSYGQENCMVCNKVFIKYHNCSKICSDECKIIRQREYEHEWRKRNSNYTKKNRKRINATQRRSYYKSKKDPEWVKIKNKRQKEWHKKKTEKEKEMIKMTDKKYNLTLEELETIKQRLAKGTSWAAIRDDMFYSYTDGYLITTTALSKQFYVWKYKQNDPPNPTTGLWREPETKALIGMWNTGLPRTLMMPVVNRTYQQIASKLTNLKKGTKLVQPNIRERNVKQVNALSPSLIQQRIMKFHGPYSTVPTLEEKSEQVIADVKELLKETPIPETDVPLELIGNLSNENARLKKANESLSAALKALEEATVGDIRAIVQAEEEFIEIQKQAKEIHNSNLKTKQGNPAIIDDDGNQLDKTSQNIVTQCQYICDLLLAKNKQYGDSVSKPLRIFSKADSSEQIKVRIDDKISRLVRGDDSLESDEDIIDDLIGYLILLKIQMNK